MKVPHTLLLKVNIPGTLYSGESSQHWSWASTSHSVFYIFIDCVHSGTVRVSATYVFFQMTEWLSLAMLLPLVCVQLCRSRQRCWNHSIAIDLPEGRWLRFFALIVILGMWCFNAQWTGIPCSCKGVSHGPIPDWFDMRDICSCVGRCQVKLLNKRKFGDGTKEQECPIYLMQKMKLEGYLRCWKKVQAMPF